MKKAILFVMVATMLAFAPAAMACVGFGCDNHQEPLEGSAEAQAFQHLDIAYGQSAGVQDVDQCTVTKSDTDGLAIEADVYGSFHNDPDTLLFGKGGLTITKTDIDSFSVSHVTAKLNTMDGNITMAADAGASASNKGGGVASSSAGNSGGVIQGQYLSFAQGGGGIQLATGGGYVKVSTSAGK